MTQTGASEVDGNPNAAHAERRGLPSATSVILTVSAVATAWWAYVNTDVYTKRVLVLGALSVGGLLLVTLHPALRRRVRLAVLAVLTLGVLVTAVVPRPALGADMWSYALYGRSVVVHGENPYLHTGLFHDRWTPEAGMFGMTPTKIRYGPAFIAVTIVVAAAGQDSKLAVRLIYQIGAALAVLASLWVMRRLRASPAALAFLALNPIVVLEVVRLGRMDALIGLLVVAAVLAAARERVLWATALLAVAALMKLPVAIAFVGFVPWVAVRHGRRAAWNAVALAAALFVLAYLVAGGIDALRPVIDSRGYSNDTTMWVALRSHGWARFLGDLSNDLGPVGASSSIALVVTVAVAAFATIPSLGARVPILAIGLPIVAYLVVSTNPTVWYFCWVLPLVALDVRQRAFLLAVLAYSVNLVRTHYSFALRRDVNPEAVRHFTHQIPTGLHRVLYASALWLEVATTVVLVVTTVRYLRRRRRAELTAA